MTPDEAIDIVARHYIDKAIRTAVEGGVDWSEYPEVGENDWDRVVKRAESITPTRPETDQFDEAYALLSELADDGPEGIEWQDGAAGSDPR